MSRLLLQKGVLRRSLLFSLERASVIVAEPRFLSAAETNNSAHRKLHISAVQWKQASADSAEEEKKKVSHKELLQEIADAHPDLSEPTVRKVVETLTATITNHLVDGKSVSLSGFGVFKSKERGPREYLNIQNPSGPKIKKPATQVAKFAVAKAMKDAVATGTKVVVDAKDTKKESD